MNGEFDVGIDVNAAGVAGVEVGLGAIEIADGGAQSPVKRRERSRIRAGQERTIGYVKT